MSFMHFMRFMQIMEFMSIMQLIHGSASVRIKKDGSCKEIPLFSKGYLLMIDRLFWNLPFTSAKQAEEVRSKSGIPDTEWELKWNQIVAEHEEPGARDQLQSGWNAWVVEQAGVGDVGAGAVAPMEPAEKVAGCYVDE